MDLLGKQVQKSVNKRISTCKNENLLKEYCLIKKLNKQTTNDAPRFF